MNKTNSFFSFLQLHDFRKTFSATRENLRNLIRSHEIFAVLGQEKAVDCFPPWENALSMDGGVRANPFGEVEDVVCNVRLSNSRRRIGLCVRAAGRRWSRWMDACLLLGSLLLLLSHTADASTTASKSSPMVTNPPTTAVSPYSLHRTTPAKTTTRLDTTPVTAFSDDTTLDVTAGHENATLNTTAHPDNTTSSTKGFFYWMVLSVEVIGDDRNESHITEWLKETLLTHLDTCATPDGQQVNSTTPTPSITSSQPTIMSSNTAYDQTGQSDTATALDVTMATTMSTSTTATSSHMSSRGPLLSSSHMSSRGPLLSSSHMSSSDPLLSHSTTVWPQNQSTTGNSTEAENGTDSSVFQDIEVCCEHTVNISQTVCTVLVKLSSPRHPCCFRYSLWNASLTNNEPIYASILNNTVKLLKGVWHNDSTSLPPGGDAKKCNSSLASSEDCRNSSPVNCTISGESQTVDSASDCPSEFEVSGPCDCPQNCSTAAYYGMALKINNPSITPSNITSMVNQLNHFSCDASNSSNSTCLALFKVSKVYEKNLLLRSTEPGPPVFWLILKLSKEVSISTVDTAVQWALSSLLQSINITKMARRVVYCGGDEVPSSKVRSTELSLTFLQFCRAGPAVQSILQCHKGEMLIVEFKDPGPAHRPRTTTTPLIASTRATPNFTTAIPVSSNTTCSTTSAGEIRTTSTAPANNSSTAATQTSSRTPVTTVTTPSTVSNVVNPSAATTVTTPPTVSNVVNPSAATTVTTPSTVSNVVNPSAATTVTTPSTVSNVANPSAITTVTTLSTATTITNATVIIQTVTKVPLTTTAASSAEEEADKLLALTRDVSSLNSSQVEQLVSQLEALLSGPNVSLALGRTSVNIVSNLLDATADTLASSATRLIRIVDAVGLKLVLTEQTQSILFDSLALAVRRVDGTNFRETTFSLTDATNLQNGLREARSVLGVRGRADTPQGSITLPSTLTQNLSPQQQQQASRLQFNFYQRSTLFQDRTLALGNRTLNSGILSTSVANLSLSGLEDDIIITLRNNEKQKQENSTVCVFWDFTFNDGSGGWNSNGCSVLNVTDEQTTCSCNHLTSFGILLNLNGPIDQLQALILTYITYIGCGLSAIFLSLTLLTYLAFGKLRKDIPSKILIQLCFALLLLNLVFLLDAWLALYTEAVGLCISTAFFLHYFLLCAFTWMGLEAVHMYIALVKVFNSYISHFMLKFSLVGWGVPLAVVIIVIAIDKDNYGLRNYGKYSDSAGDEFCWLRNDVVFYVTVVAYFCVIFLVNLVMFVVVLVQLRRLKRQNPHNSLHRSRLQEARSIAGLTVLLGLTWGFGFFTFFAENDVNLAFMYLFCIFNTFQGFFIFVFHCAYKENVRRYWRTYLCCGKLRLSEKSDWSRTATQNKNRAISQNSSSSSTSLAPDLSIRTQSTRGPSDDRMMPESNSDIVHNEINNQYHNPSQANWITNPSYSTGS